MYMCDMYMCDMYMCDMYMCDMYMCDMYMCDMYIQQCKHVPKHTFFDGYCSTVQGLLDWFEVDLGFVIRTSMNT